MATPSELLEAIAPETQSVDPDVIAVHIGLAEAQTGNVYKDSRDYAVALLAAHGLTLSERRGAGGRISSQTEGQLGAVYQNVGFDGELTTTSYGIELQRLRRQYIFSARTVLV